MNQNLMVNVDLAEFKEALFNINPNNAPGMDGMTSAFFQHFWDLIHINLFQLVNSFFESGQLLISLNHTLITLIPKTQRPEKLTHFRPISLCSLLASYNQITGQQINLHKSSIYFSKNTPSASKHSISQILLGIQIQTNSKYLG
ncbi:DNAse I-like superfamily protein, partial [Striga hermonthica]